MAAPGGERKQDAGSTTGRTESFERIREQLIKSRQACIGLRVCVCLYLYMCAFACRFDCAFALISMFSVVGY